MNYADQVAQAMKVMQANIAAQTAALRLAQERAHHQRSKDLQESFSGAVPVHGKFLVNGPGEAHKDVKFNVAFTNVPVVTFGFEIKGPDNLSWTDFNEYGDPIRARGESYPGYPAGGVSGLIEGEAPIITAFVLDWDMIENPPMDQKYIGARIVTVCEGPEATSFICHWTASGMALANPSAGTMDADNKVSYSGLVDKFQNPWQPPQRNGTPLSYEAWKDQQPPKVFTQDMVSDGNGGLIDRGTKYWQDHYQLYLKEFQGRSGWYEGEWYRADETPPGYGG